MVIWKAIYIGVAILKWTLHVLLHRCVIHVAIKLMTSLKCADHLHLALFDT